MCLAKLKSIIPTNPILIGLLIVGKLENFKDSLSTNKDLTVVKSRVDICPSFVDHTSVSEHQ